MFHYEKGKKWTVQICEEDIIVKLSNSIIDPYIVVEELRSPELKLSRSLENVNLVLNLHVLQCIADCAEYITRKTSISEKKIRELPYLSLNLYLKVRHSCSDFGTMTVTAPRVLIVLFTEMHNTIKWAASRKKGP